MRTALIHNHCESQCFGCIYSDVTDRPKAGPIVILLWLGLDETYVKPLGGLGATTPVAGSELLVTSSEADLPSPRALYHSRSW
jgi:hypothetical protein